MYVFNKKPPHRHRMTVLVEMRALPIENVLLGSGATCYFPLYFHEIKQETENCAK